MADPREPLGRLVHEQRLAHEAGRAAEEGRVAFFLKSWEERTVAQRDLDMRIGAAVAAAAAEARLAEVRQVAVNFRSHHGGILHPSAEALYHAVIQTIDRDKPSEDGDPHA